MVCPLSKSASDEEKWSFHHAQVWYARVVFFFSATIDCRRTGKGTHDVRLAYVEWLHDYDTTSVRESDIIPVGKEKWKGFKEQTDDVFLYEPCHPVDYQVIAVNRIVGQAFLMPNFETLTIPYYMRRYKKQIFPYGAHDSEDGNRKGSKLWVVNKGLMMQGRSNYSVIGQGGIEEFSVGGIHHQ